jgi:hypothetical protein
MRFSDLDESFVLSELGAAPAMIGQPVPGQPVAPPSGGTTAPVNQVNQQQQAAIMIQQKQKQREDLQKQIADAEANVRALRKQLSEIK